MRTGFVKQMKEERGVFPSMGAIFCFIVVLCLGHAYAQGPDGLTFEPLRFDPPEPRIHRLSNGVPVYLLEDRELPLVRVDVLVKGGTLYESPEQTGVFDILADMLRAGGTTTHSPETVDEILESMAASVEIGFGSEYGTGSIDLLAEDLEPGIEIFADILLRPRFQEDRLDLRKKQEIEAIRRRNDDPFDIATRLFNARIYGSDHPLGSYADITRIERISSADLREIHGGLFTSDRVTIAVSGDFQRRTALKLLERHFGAWNEGEAELPAPPQPELYRGAPLVVHIEKDLNQSTIVMGQTSLIRTPDNTDIYALRVMNEILGESSFTSRLFQEVREKRGLAYSVGSRFDTSSYTFPGTWFAFTQTRAEKTVETASIMLDTIERLKLEPVTGDELRLIKDSIGNSFVFGFESSHGITRQRMILDFRGYPEDYLTDYTRNIEGVTIEDVQRVARRYLDLDHIVIVVVGNDVLFEEPLGRLGEVVSIDLKDSP
jgi:predicted Zn-dependent peptidase